MTNYFVLKPCINKISFGKTSTILISSELMGNTYTSHNISAEIIEARLFEKVLLSAIFEA